MINKDPFPDVGEEGHCLAISAPLQESYGSCGGWYNDIRLEEP
jgi:hypothetical protein